MWKNVAICRMEKGLINIAKALEEIEAEKISNLCIKNAKKLKNAFFTQP